MIMFGCCLTKTLVAITLADAELKEKLIFYALRQTVRYDPRVVYLRCVMPLSSTGSSHAARALLLWREHHPQRVTNNNPAGRRAVCSRALFPFTDAHDDGTLPAPRTPGLAPRTAHRYRERRPLFRCDLHSEFVISSDCHSALLIRPRW